MLWQRGGPVISVKPRNNDIVTASICSLAAIIFSESDGLRTRNRGMKLAPLFALFDSVHEAKDPSRANEGKNPITSCEKSWGRVSIAVH